MADAPISSLGVFVGTLPSGTYLEVATPDALSSTGFSSFRATANQIAALATGFVPTSRRVDGGVGIAGGGTLATDLTLTLDLVGLPVKTSMAVTEQFAINDSVNAGGVVTFPNAMKALTGLTALALPNLNADYLIINHAADGLTYKVTPSALGLAVGNLPAGGTTGQVLVKASNTNYDTIWSTNSQPNEPANTVLAGPTSGADATPTFRALVGTDLPNPASTTKGGVKSYAAVSNQFLTSITTGGLPVSAQPAFTDISGTATVAQGGTGAATLTNHGVLLGQGASAIAAVAVMTDGQLLVGQSAADPLPKSVSGDVTISALGVTAIGANKVTSAMLRQGAALSVMGVTGSSTANEADIPGTANQVLRVNSAGTALAFGQVNLASGSAVTGTLPSTLGGTDNSSYAVGDLLYASGTTTLAKLADIATGNALISGGVTTAPSWGKIGLTTHVSGTLPIANGGTANTTAIAAFDALAPTTLRGDLIARGASNNARLAIGSANTVLRSDGTDPAWGKVDLATDTTGSLIVANGGTGDSSFTVNGILYGNNTSSVQVTAAGTNGTILSGNTGAAPTFKTVSDTLDAIANTQGQIIYRSSAGWQSLAVGTNGQVLATQGAGADPHWLSVSGVGTVTSVDVSGGTTGLTTSGGPITAAGTITLAGTLATANGGTNLTSYTQGDLLYASSSSVLAKLAKDTNATRYLANTGSSNNPAWAQVALATGVSGTLPVGNGGTGITSGTSGGVPYFSASNTIASSAELTANAIVKGGGAGAAPVASGVSIDSSNNVSGIGTLASAAHTITSAGASALAVGRLGATTPAFQVDASTATSITGIKIKSAASTGGVAVSAIGETNVNLTVDAAGSGTIVLGGTSTGAITLTRATTLSAALTYGGVALSNAVTGTGNMALSASPTFTGTVTTAALSATTLAASTSATVTSASATALAVGLNGATNPALLVDASTASSATGLKVKSAAAAGGLAVSVITSGTNENLTIDAAGSGTITLGGTSTGAIVLTRATTLSAALTYGGVALSNAVTGTGSMVLSSAPTFTGTLNAATVTASGALSTTLTTDSSSISTGSGIFAGGVGIAKKLYVGTGINVASSGAAAGLFYGYASITGANSTANGEVRIGLTSGQQGVIQFEDVTNGFLYIDNTWDDTTAAIKLRSRTAGTAKIMLSAVPTSTGMAFPQYGAGTLSTDVSGNITATSDARLKDITGSFTRSLDALQRIGAPVKYDWKKESGLVGGGIGWTTQNVRKGIPEAVGIAPDGYETLSDRPIIAALYNAVMALQKEIAALKASSK